MVDREVETVEVVDYDELESFAAEAAAPFLGERPHSVERVPRPGAVNHVFLVRGKASGVVVRTPKEEDLQETLSGYRAEQWCMEQAHKKSIPVPRFLHIGESNGRGYMVQTLVVGHDGDSCAADRGLVWRRLGHYAKIIHTVDIDLSGRSMVDRDNLLSERSGLRDQIRYNIASLGPDDELARLGVYDRSLRDDIALVFRSLESIDVKFGLSHGDLSPRNIVIDGSGTPHLLDWGCAVVAPIPHRDIKEMFIDLMNDCDGGEVDMRHVYEFGEGYGVMKAEFDRLLVEVEAYLLLTSFDVVRWAIGNKPERVSQLAERARRVMKRAAARPVEP